MRIRWLLAIALACVPMPASDGVAAETEVPRDIRVLPDFDDIRIRYARVDRADEPLAYFYVLSPDATVEIAAMRFQLGSSSASDRISDVTDLRLWDQDGTPVSGPVDAVGDGSEGSFHFDDSILLPQGTTRYTITGRIGPSFVHNRSITVSMNPARDWVDASEEPPHLPDSDVVLQPVRSKTRGVFEFANEVSIVQGYSECINQTEDPPIPDFDCANGQRRWTPEEAAQAMHRYPNHYLDLGPATGTVPGSPKVLDWRDRIDALQEYAAKLGIDPSRIAIVYRADVYTKYSKLDLRNCSDPTLGCPWEGDMDGSKGDTPFDTDWVARVPRGVHRRLIQDLWDDRDPFAGWSTLSFPDFLDFKTLIGLTTVQQKIALYGWGLIWGRGPRMQVSSVIVDLRIPENRTWQAKRFLYLLEDMGIDPGEPFTLAMTSKPGWHVYFDSDNEEPPDDPCYIGHLSNGTPVNRWTPITHNCAADPKVFGYQGPYYPNTYGPGEFEEAFEALVAEIRQEVLAAGYPDFDIVTIERPEYRDQKWASVSDEFLTEQPVVGNLLRFEQPDVHHLRMLGPLQDEILDTSPAEFRWFEDFRVEQYRLDAATSMDVIDGGGEGDIFSDGDAPEAGMGVPVPLTGEPIYVRLSYKVGDEWLQEDYTYATRELDRLAQDSCEGARLVVSSPFGNHVDTTLATSVETGADTSCGDGVEGATVWYRIQTDVPSHVSVDTEGSGYDTIASLFTGECGSLSHLVCSPDEPGAARLEFEADPDVAYLVRIGDRSSGVGGSLSVTVIIQAPEPGGAQLGLAALLGLAWLARRRGRRS